MDGGVDVDGSMRESVLVADPVMQPYVEREKNLAAAQCREPTIGSAVSITGAFQSTFPPYRQRSSFGSLETLPPGVPPTHFVLSAQEVFTVNKRGEIVGIARPDGNQSTRKCFERDAAAWASHFARDVFYNHCSSHEHDCKEPV